MLLYKQGIWSSLGWQFGLALQLWRKKLNYFRYKKTTTNLFKKKIYIYKHVCTYIFIYIRIRKLCSVTDGHLNTQVAGAPNPKKEGKGLSRRRKKITFKFLSLTVKLGFNWGYGNWIKGEEFLKQ